MARWLAVVAQASSLQSLHWPNCFQRRLASLFNAFLQNSPVPNNCLIGIADAYKICAVDATKSQPKVFSNPLEKTNSAGVWRSPGVNIMLNSFILCFDVLADIALQLRAIARFVVSSRANQRGRRRCACGADQGAQGNSRCCFEVLCSHAPIHPLTN